jgi:serine/threonine protein phosphatase PrpC
MNIFGCCGGYSDWNTIELHSKLSPETVEDKIRRANGAALQQQRDEIEILENKLEHAPVAEKAGLNLKLANVKSFDQFLEDSSIPEVLQGGHDLEIESFQSDTIPDCYISSCQGYRPRQEDAFVASAVDVRLSGKPTKIQITAVLDGHGGTSCSEYASKKIVEYISQNIERYTYGSRDKNKDIWCALKNSFVEINGYFSIKAAGSCCNLAMVIDSSVWVANIGDSRAILVDDETGECFQLSKDQKPDDPEFKSSIEKRGGIVENGRIDGLLAPARAFGDPQITGKSALPKITNHELIRGRSYSLYQFCDGVTDVLTTDLIAKFMQERQGKLGESLHGAIVSLIQAAITLGSKDNVTVVARKIKL